MLIRFIEACKVIEQVLHVSKPLLVEIFMFAWAFYELVRFGLAVIGGN